MEGVGVTFLEETFGAANADQKHRLHQNSGASGAPDAAPGTRHEIKGNMRSRQELMEASGYGRPLRRTFEGDSIRILDNEVRLITPTDLEGADSAVPNTAVPNSTVRNATVQTGQKCYQLTHDYLVPALREWLTRKQRETRRGRAELRLAYQAAVWKTERQSRSLPAFLDWIQIQALTDRKQWSGSQRTMMRVASRHYVCSVRLSFWPRRSSDGSAARRMAGFVHGRRREAVDRRKSAMFPIS